MISNKNILNDFGRLIIKDGYDSGINLVDDLKQITKPPYIIKEEASFVKSLNDEQINGLKKLFLYSLKPNLMNIQWILL